MYARTVGGRTLNFGVSGMLYRDALVMYDRETGTLWTQVDGRAVRGPLLGQELQAFPSIHATWAEWKSLYPDSVVLRKQGQHRSAYEAYNRDQGRLGISGRRLKNAVMPPKERILGLRYGGAALAVAVKDIRQAGIVEARVGGLPVVLAGLGAAMPIVAFERGVAGRVLSFTRVEGADAVFDDVETRSRWSPADGLAIDGPLKGERLRRVTVYPAFWFGWFGYFPETAVWRPSR